MDHIKLHICDIQRGMRCQQGVVFNTKLQIRGWLTLFEYIVQHEKEAIPI
jgi:hypothetical protein